MIVLKGPFLNCMFGSKYIAIVSASCMGELFCGTKQYLVSCFSYSQKNVLGLVLGTCKLKKNPEKLKDLLLTMIVNQ